MKIGDEVYIHGYVDEIRRDTVIIRNEGGYFGTDLSEVIDGPEQKKGKWKREYLTSKATGEHLSIFYCSECNQCIAYPVNYCPNCGAKMGAE